MSYRRRRVKLKRHDQGNNRHDPTRAWQDKKARLHDLHQRERSQRWQQRREGA